MVLGLIYGMVERTYFMDLGCNSIHSRIMTKNMTIFVVEFYVMILCKFKDVFPDNVLNLAPAHPLRRPGRQVRRHVRRDVGHLEDVQGDAQAQGKGRSEGDGNL